jgi:sigma-B regulation protein RsbU (phosphoserine phosphatase)
MALSVTVLRFGMSLNLPPEEVTRRANEIIITDQRSRMFATTFIGYLNEATGEMTFASGGHNPALIYRAASGQIEYVSAPGVAVGIFKSAVFEPRTVTLAPGDVFVLYTDGITEAIDAAEEEFGEGRMESLIASNSHLPAETLTNLITDAVDNFVGDIGLFDDATLVILKRVVEVAPEELPG